MEIKTIIKM